MIKLKDEVKFETSEAVTNYINTIINTNTATVEGNNNITNQGGTVNQSIINTGNQNAKNLLNITDFKGNLNIS